MALLFSPIPLRADPGDETSAAVVISIEGKVEILRKGGRDWIAASPGLDLATGDQLRTGPRSRAMIRLSNLSVLRVGELMEYELQPSRVAGGKPTLNLKTGSAYFFSRDKPQEIHLRTPVVTGAIRGTEFNVTVAPDGRTTVTMIDGVVELTNDEGSATLIRNEQGVVEPGRAPVKTAVINAINVVQWCLYYPAVLDLNDLDLDAATREALDSSLTAYRAGDLPAALENYPSNRQPASESERIYLAGLLLSVGLVGEAESQLTAVGAATGNLPRLANALRQMIAAVKHQSWSSASSPELATEWLAEAYYQQSRADLPAALAAARNAVKKSPDFGYARERVAELEFSFGRTADATTALNRSLELSPRNAQAVALRGFLLSARNEIKNAEAAFEQAIQLDGALANAWLGRGLCRIRRGGLQAGLEDLQVAAALEPNRSELRSYLGKGFSEAGDDRRAEQELQLARQFDPKDPTSWLYSALLHQQENRVNQAVRDLEQSELLNDNRAVYRSRLLLDQDAAVRGANLAAIYQDAGMEEVSVREATRAVNYDYGNFSAHLFLANSYNQLRDPNQINLRYETPWLSEFLLANLLAPVGAGTLSQIVSQQDYSKLFTRDGFSVASSTAYYSAGDWVQAGSQYGTFGNFSYAFDAYYLSDNGQRPNNDQQQLTLSTQVKLQVTPADSVYLQAVYYDASGGDLAQYYDPNKADQSLRTTEKQEPLLLFGYRHEWAPGVQTLVMAGRFNDTQTVATTNQPAIVLARVGSLTAFGSVTNANLLNYQDEITIYTAEAQQIWEQDRHTLVLGARYQTGNFDTQDALLVPTPAFLATGLVPSSANTSMERISGYGYFNYQVLDPLLLSAGLTYDYLQYPVNFRVPPIASGETSTDQLSPKAGFIWTPARGSTISFAYTRSLGGVSFDQSARLEPTQLAGFTQAYRSLIPESVAGSIPGASFTTYGLAFEQKFETGTYFTIEGGLLNSDADNTLGTVTLALVPPATAYGSSTTPQTLDYQEKNFQVTVNQLLGQCWSLGTRYRLSRAELQTSYPGLPAGLASSLAANNSATLQTVSLFALFNHRCGFFARADANWYTQQNGGYQPYLPGDEFWQINLSAGYRFWRRRAQVQVGVLNVTDQDYQLNPLNLYPELWRHRTFAASFQFNF